MLRPIGADARLHIAATGFMKDLITDEVLKEPSYPIRGCLKIPQQAIQETDVEEEELRVLDQAARKTLRVGVHPPNQETILKYLKVAPRGLSGYVGSGRNLGQVEILARPGAHDVQEARKPFEIS